MKKINERAYLIIYALNKLTKKWLDNVNDYIKDSYTKDNLDNIFANSKHDNVNVSTKKAIAKYSKEDTAKIELYKSQFTPINQGATTLYVDVSITPTARDKAEDILANAEDTSNDNDIKRVASTLTKNKSNVKKAVCK